ncbi:hypothetical protein HK101_000782, partial [Irineochytrium annulatum]
TLDKHLLAERAQWRELEVMRKDCLKAAEEMQRLERESSKLQQSTEQREKDINDLKEARLQLCVRGASEGIEIVTTKPSGLSPLVEALWSYVNDAVMTRLQPLPYDAG